MAHNLECRVVASVEPCDRAMARMSPQKVLTAFRSSSGLPSFEAPADASLPVPRISRRVRPSTLSIREPGQIYRITIEEHLPRGNSTPPARCLSPIAGTPAMNALSSALQYRMTSYRHSFIREVSQLVADDHGPNLTHLIRPGHRISRLKIQDLFDINPRKDVVIATNTFREADGVQK